MNFVYLWNFWISAIFGHSVGVRYFLEQSLKITRLRYCEVQTKIIFFVCISSVITNNSAHSRECLFEIKQQQARSLSAAKWQVNEWKKNAIESFRLRRTHCLIKSSCNTQLDKRLPQIYFRMALTDGNRLKIPQSFRGVEAFSVQQHPYNIFIYMKIHDSSPKKTFSNENSFF